MSDNSSRPLLNIGDLAGLKDPLVKLIETVSAGFGRASDGIARVANAYWLASKDTKNEMERMRLIEGTRTQLLTERAQIFSALASDPYKHLKELSVTGDEVAAQFTGLPAELIATQERSRYRIACENTINQLNLEAVEGFAADVLVHESAVTAEPVNPDWAARLRNIVKDISDEEMQILWGNILAGEIKQPGSYSLRTLEVLRNLTQHEAHLFRIAANFTIRSEKECMIGLNRVGHSRVPFTKYGLSITNLRELVDCGLISANDSSIGFSAGNPDDKEAVCQIGNQVLICRSEISVISHYSVYFYTKVGNELYSLVAKGARIPIEYLVEFTAPMRTNGLSTFYAELTGELTNGSFTYKEPLIEIPKEAN